MIPKIKFFVKENKKDILFFITIILIIILSFSLGYVMAKIEGKGHLEYEKPLYEEISADYYKIIN